MSDDIKEEEKSKEEPPAVEVTAVTSLEEVMRKNAERKRRKDAERHKSNEGVLKSYRIK